ncbi:MAG: glycosyltransferase [Rhodoferax sp.]
MSVFERKNPLAVVAAFSAAFDEGEGPILVIKTINGDRLRTDRERLRAACSVRRDIFLLEEYLPGQVVKSLMADATAYVSLHRSEGYGLTMAEAMTLGVPVVATGYSGNVDFMNSTTKVWPCCRISTPI